MSITAAMVKELREKTGAAMMACKKALQETAGDVKAAVEVLRKAGAAKAEKRAGKTAAEGKVAVVNNAKSAVIIEVNSETDFVSRDENFKNFVAQVAEKALAAKAKNVTETLAIEVDGQSIETIRQQLVSKIGENIQIRRVRFIESEECIGSYCHGDRIGVLVSLDKDNAEIAKDIAMHIAATSPLAISPEDVDQDIVNKEREIFLAQAVESGKPKEIAEKMVQGRVNKFLKEISLTSQPFVKDPNISIADLLKTHDAKVLAFVRFEVGEGIEKEEQNFADEVMAQIQGKE